MSKKILDFVLIFFCLFALTVLLITVLTIRDQQQKMYELEQRIFYIEDILINNLYGPEFYENRQVNFNDY